MGSDDNPFSPSTARILFANEVLNLSEDRLFFLAYIFPSHRLGFNTLININDFQSGHSICDAMSTSLLYGVYYYNGKIAYLLINMSYKMVIIALA